MRERGGRDIHGVVFSSLSREKDLTKEREGGRKRERERERMRERERERERKERQRNSVAPETRTDIFLPVYFPRAFSLLLLLLPARTNEIAPMEEGDRSRESAFFVLFSFPRLMDALTYFFVRCASRTTVRT